jgi:hypothetical protein
MTRVDEVAAVLLSRIITDQTREAMKKIILRLSKHGATRPGPDTRLGLCLVALTTLDTRQPSPEELVRAYPRVVRLLTQEEKVRFQSDISLPPLNMS